MRENNKSALVLFFLVLGLGTLSAFAQGPWHYDAAGKRNPFIPLVTPDGRLVKLEEDAGGRGPGLALTGIVFDKYGMSYALVNGEPVKVGDVVGDYQVLKIEKRKVIFIKEGQLQEIELPKEEGAQ
jgi:hypothetical protein